MIDRRILPINGVIERPGVPAGGSLRVPMSYAEFVMVDETTHPEYYDGFCVMNPPDLGHSLAQTGLVATLGAHAPKRGKVLQGWRWQTGDEGPVFMPDVMVVSRDVPDVDILCSAAPELVVEVVARATHDVDLGFKPRAYADAGAPWYWVFDIESVELTVFENRAGEFVEVQRIAAGERVTTVGPFPVPIDPNAIVED